MSSKFIGRAVGMDTKATGRFTGMGSRPVGRGAIRGSRGDGLGSRVASVIVNLIDAPIRTQTSQGNQYAAW